MERQMGEALLRMSDVAVIPEGGLAASSRTNAHANGPPRARLEQPRLEPVRTHRPGPVQALVTETEKMLRLVKGNDLRDAALIASAQKLEHYEMAAYGTAAALAGQLELHEDQTLLHDSLEEERETEALLTKLAKGEVNQDACSRHERC
jgi:ferritin-like metal-binding protein YciE